MQSYIILSNECTSTCFFRMRVKEFLMFFFSALLLLTAGVKMGDRRGRTEALMAPSEGLWYGFDSLWGT